MYIGRFQTFDVFHLLVSVAEFVCIAMVIYCIPYRVSHLGGVHGADHSLAGVDDYHHDDHYSRDDHHDDMGSDDRIEETAAEAFEQHGVCKFCSCLKYPAPIYVSSIILRASCLLRIKT